MTLVDAGAIFPRLGEAETLPRVIMALAPRLAHRTPGESLLPLRRPFKRRNVTRPPWVIMVALWMPVALQSFPAVAQAVPIRQSIGFHAGGSLPVAPNQFKTLWSAGYGLSGVVRFRLTPRIHADLEVGYYRHLSDNAAFKSLIAQQQPNVTVSGYDLWVVPISLVGEFDLLKRSSTKPYLIVGGGYYKFGVTKAAISGLGSDAVQLPDPTETAFGVQGGLGVRTPISLGITLSFDINVHVSFTADEFTQFMPVRLGLQF